MRELQIRFREVIDENDLMKVLNFIEELRKLKGIQEIRLYASDYIIFEKKEAREK